MKTWCNDLAQPSRHIKLITASDISHQELWFNITIKLSVFSLILQPWLPYLLFRCRFFPSHNQAYSHWTRYSNLRRFDSLIAFNYKQVSRKTEVLTWMIINTKQFTISRFSRTEDSLLRLTFMLIKFHLLISLIESLWPQTLPEICIFLSSFR